VLKIPIGSPIRGIDCFEWPEFKALIHRLGVELDTISTRQIVLTVPFDGGFMEVEQIFYPADHGKVTQCKH